MSGAAGSDRGRPRGVACPTCRALVDRAAAPAFPFCSERCAMADLGRWLGEEYRIPDPGDGLDALADLDTDASGGDPRASAGRRGDERGPSAPHHEEP